MLKTCRLQGIPPMLRGGSEQLLPDLLEAEADLLQPASAVLPAQSDPSGRAPAAGGPLVPTQEVRRLSRSPARPPEAVLACQEIAGPICRCLSVQLMSAAAAELRLWCCAGQ